MDETAPPKRLRIRDPRDELDDVTVTLTWESPCPEMDRKLGYNVRTNLCRKPVVLSFYESLVFNVFIFRSKQITLKDLKLNHEYGLSNISYSNASHLEHRIDVQYGGRYQ